MNWNRTINTHTGLKGERSAKNWFAKGICMAVAGAFVLWFAFWPIAGYCFWQSYQARKSIV